MISVKQAESLILQAVSPLSTEWVDLLSARDRVLAEPITSPSDFPTHDISSMDGYAVRHTDLQEIPSELAVIETIPAGQFPQNILQTGQAARLFTGSVLPQGADTVIMQEHTERPSEQVVRILQPASQGQFLRKQGHFCKAGDLLMSPGLRLQASEMAVLAAIRRAIVSVYRRPQVALLSTGDELVRIDQIPQPGQIVDSNHYGLAALVEAAGAVPIRYGIVPDDLEVLRSRMRDALNTTDIVISSGGVSVGDFDYVEKLLAELGGDIQIRSIAIKPGKPLTFATFSSISGFPKLYFGLPGNPVSALVTFWRLVQPALAKLQGQSPPWGPTFLTAVTQMDLKSDGKRESYLWGNVKVNAEQLLFTPRSDHNSGNLINLAGCNGLAVMPVGWSTVVAGSPIQVMVTRALGF